MVPIVRLVPIENDVVPMVLYGEYASHSGEKPTGKQILSVHFIIESYHLLYPASVLVGNTYFFAFSSRVHQY